MGYNRKHDRFGMRPRNGTSGLMQVSSPVHVCFVVFHKNQNAEGSILVGVDDALSLPAPHWVVPHTISCPRGRVTNASIEDGGGSS